MRKLVLKMHVSVDGFVGGPKGEIDWIFKTMDDEAVAWTVDTLWQAGLHAMGGVTYRDMAAHWPGSTEPYAAPMNEIPKVAFSRSLAEAPWGETTIANGDLAEEMARLKREPGRDILAHGGARFAQALVRARLIDEYRLVVHPVALGSGLPLFPSLEAPIHLALVSATPFAGGAVGKVYRPV